MDNHTKQVFPTPVGVFLDKTVGSPLSGHDFITNGKSVLNGQMRALLRVKSLPSGISQLTKPKPMVISEPTKHVDQVIDRDYVKTVNDLARAKFKKKMLSDILCDMQICEIEGWCKRFIPTPVGNGFCVEEI